MTPEKMILRGILSGNVRVERIEGCQCAQVYFDNVLISMDPDRLDIMPELYESERDICMRPVCTPNWEAKA